jgi:hypothetical protein
VKYFAQTTPPASPQAGDKWYSTTDDVLYEYINDGYTNYWVDISSSGVSSNSVSITGALVASIPWEMVFLTSGM